MVKKPSTSVAMQDLINQIRSAIPFDTPESVLCAGTCHGCSKKLLEFLSRELDDWESQLQSGEIPTLGEIDRLAKTSKKIYRVLQKNRLV
ncbi:hypothetical protein [Spartinivicinus marinus]|nr:hypothetical protein [Spartinivicinus marinus]MCX4025290.1 hypothetical protein [Spartinivicinus marinus]